MDSNGGYQLSWPDTGADPTGVYKDGSLGYLAWNGFPINNMQEGAAVARHQGQMNVIYCDGHSKNVSLTFLVSPEQRSRNTDGSLNANGYLRQFTPADD